MKIAKKFRAFGKKGRRKRIVFKKIHNAQLFIVHNGEILWFCRESKKRSLPFYTFLQDFNCKKELTLFISCVLIDTEERCAKAAASLLYGIEKM